MNETALKSMKKAYLQKVTRKRANEKKRGRPVLLVERLDGNVKMYLRRVQDRGGVVITVTAARGVMSCDHLKLAEFGGHVMLTRFWAYSLLKRMNFVKQK